MTLLLMGAYECNIHVVNVVKTAVHFGKKIHPNTTHGGCLYNPRGDIPKVSSSTYLANEGQWLKGAKSPFLVYISVIFNFFEEIPYLKNIQEKMAYNEAVLRFLAGVTEC